MIRCMLANKSFLIKPSPIFCSKMMQLCAKLKSPSKQEINFMMKIMKGSKNPKMKTLRSLDQELRKGLIMASALSNTESGRVNLRRRTVINDLFARHIANQMADSELHGFDIQLTRVLVAPDLSIVKVHWISRKCLIGHVDLLQTELDTYSTTLRKELSNLRVLGDIPPIKFLPDKALGHGAVLDQLLVNAEMSDELPKEMDMEVALPPMKNNVFGLDRELIMSKVIRKGKKVDIPQVQEVEHIDLEQIKSHINEFKLKMKAAHKRQHQKLRQPRANLDLRPVIEIESVEYFEEKYDEPDYLDDDDRKK